MKDPNTRLFAAAGLALAGLAAVPSVRADTTVFFAGGNASQNVLYDRVTNVLSGGVSSLTVASSKRHRPHLCRHHHRPVRPRHRHDSFLAPRRHRRLAGSQRAKHREHRHRNHHPRSDRGRLQHVAGSGGGRFLALCRHANARRSLRLHQAANVPALAGITNLTQRQAYYLQGSAGTVPISYYGGTSTNYLYFVARNTAAAVRTEIDAMFNFTGTPRHLYHQRRRPADSGSQPRPKFGALLSARKSPP